MKSSLVPEQQASATTKSKNPVRLEANFQPFMNTTTSRLGGSFWRVLAILISLALHAATTQAQVPTMISYQGRVLMDSVNFNGTGQFKFALVRGPGPTLLWKNDGSAGNTEPAAAVSLPVANGLVMTSLGDAALANMTAIPATVFEQPDVRLRVWFNGGAGFQQLTPDQRIVSVGYAMMAGNVADGSITAAKLANNAINSAKITDGSISSTDLAPNSVNTGHIIDGQVMTADLADNAVTSAKVANGSLLGADLANGTVGTDQLASSIALGAAGVSGSLDVFRTAAGTRSISLNGPASQISTYGSDGLEQIRLWGGTYGELLLNNSLPNNATAVRLTAQGTTGGQLELRNTNGSSRAVLEGENTGGALTLYASDGGIGAVLYGNEGQGSGALSLRNTNGNPRLRAYGGPGSGRLLAYNTAGQETVDIDAEPAGLVAVRNAAGGTRAYMWAGGSQGGEIRNYEEDGTLTTYIHNVSDAGVVSMRNASGIETVYLWGRNNAGQTGGQIGLKNSSGVETITLNADVAGEGRIYTQVLTITGGSDLSENFEVNAEEDELQPGMVVSIDPKNPGQLVLAGEAYDNKVAGIVSGAGGVKPGMLMGQKGTLADGKHPVALTGRVYCWVDASHGAVEPGDMITTSTTPGHGMKATDRDRAFGSIIGKAMTGLSEGKGLVLVLVSLQ
jgi:hypothetical protein